MRTDELLNLLRDASLTDLYVPGFYDDGSGRIGREALPGGALVFHPLFDDVYLELGRLLVHLHSTGQHSRLSVTLAEKIECPFEIDPEEGLDGFGVMPLLRLALQSGRDSVKVTKLDVFLEEGCDPEQCMFAALGMECDSGEYIFFDPLDFDGIHIGSTRTREPLESYSGRHPNIAYTVRSYDVAAKPQ
jgi:hypothetical protein